MAVVFTASSSQRIINSATPVTTFPFTVGYWLKMPNSASDQVSWSLVDTASVTEYWAVYKNSSNILVQNVNAGAGYSEIASTNAIGDNQWTYVLVRIISATNRRFNVLHWNGVIDSVQSTTSRSPASIDRVCLGMSDYSTPDSPMDGSIAEYFMANVDVHRGGGAIPATYLRQIAYGGPFSVPFIERNLVDYRSFRQSLTSDQDNAYDYHLGGQRPVRQVWTNVNGATLGPHVPLPGYYERPVSNRTMVLV